MRKQTESYCYAGKILRVNLSRVTVSEEYITNEFAKNWIGSSGFAVKILYDELKDWVNPYEPANKIVFSAGLFLGTPMPGACKSNISTLAPMTGGWGSSCCDSYTGAQLKYAGYDSVIIEGRASRPVYLYIDNQQVQIKDGRFLWGNTTSRTLELLRKEYDNPNLHCISIGPAGENLVRGACVIQDRSRAFGRGGVGAVLGSKNLKAIVAVGKGRINAANPDRFMIEVKKLRNQIKASASAENMRTYGNLFYIEGKQNNCGLPYKNFQEVYVPEETAEATDPRKLSEKYFEGRQSAPGCVVKCGVKLHITDGPYKGLHSDANQWETYATLQTRLAVDDLTFQVKVNNLCNDMGIDVDAAGGALGWAMECYQRGILDESDTDGLSLEWGNAENALVLIEKTAKREGFGDLLAESAAKAAEILGRNSSYYAVNVKGLDLYEPGRANLGWMLGAATATRGGGHTTGAVGGYKKLNKTAVTLVDDDVDIFDPSSYEKRPEAAVYMEALHRIVNCFGVCQFHTIHSDQDHFNLVHLIDIYEAGTGWETSVNELKLKGMRQLNLEKVFNLRFTHFDRNDDFPPLREQHEAIPTGPKAGWKFDSVLYNRMLDTYYQLHGWDRETSYPTRKTLEELDLGYAADDLERIGKLGKEEKTWKSMSSM